MALFDFSSFAEKVLNAVEGKLTDKESGVLERMFSRVRKRNTVLAAGLLSALKVGGASKRDINRFAEILEKANYRILQEKKPFTEKEEREIAKIFERAHMPKKAEARFKHNVVSDEDDLLANELAVQIQGKRRKEKFAFVPERQLKKKTEPPKEKKKKEKGRRA